MVCGCDWKTGSGSYSKGRSGIGGLVKKCLNPDAPFFGFTVLSDSKLHGYRTKRASNGIGRSSHFSEVHLR